MGYRGCSVCSAACAACGSESHDVVEQPSDFSDQDFARFEVVLKPVRERGTDVTAVEVRYELIGDIGSAETLSVRSPIVYAGRTDMADSVAELVVRDEAGVVDLSAEDDPEDPGGFPYFRHWRADRPVTTPVTVSYRVIGFPRRKAGRVGRNLISMHTMADSVAAAWHCLCCRKTWEKRPGA